MKTSFWRRWCDFPRNDNPPGPGARAGSRRRPPRLQPLEDRVTPTLTPQLVLDVNTNTLSANPSQVVAVGSTAYFTVNEGVHGVELWKSDGTAAGTAQVKDIRPGSAGPDLRELTAVNGTLFFTADDGTHGRELWRSDGTAAGTVMVKDIVPGVGSSTPTALANVGGALYFSANDGTTGMELWRTDGTAAGTSLVKDIRPGGDSSSPAWLTNVNGALFFAAVGPQGSELWRSDGTAAGTVLVKDINPGSAWSSPYSLTDVNGTLFFNADDGPHGVELWRSDGTAAGTTLVKDINPGGPSRPGNPTNVNGTLFFSADDGTLGTELWKSDGTEAGTVLVKDVHPGGSTGYYGGYYPNNSSPSGLTNVNGTLFFTAADATGGRLWKSDGTAAGTVPVSPLAVFNGNLTAMNGTLFFAASDGTNGHELWKTDGTAAGTVLVKDIYPGIGAYHTAPSNLANVNGTLFFTAHDGTHGVELWRSDGTTAGTVLVKDIDTRTHESVPRNLTEVNGTLFFGADDGTHGFELWKSDGTAAGTALVKDIFPGSNPINAWSAPANLTAVNGTLFFTADDGTHGWELWKSDGTAAGTVMVKDIYTGSSGGVPLGSAPADLTNVNGTLFFTARDAGNGRELWKSDGTAAGTVLVKDIFPGGSLYPFPPRYLTNVNGTLFFSADDGVHEVELWKSDGTADGTVMVKDIFPGSAYSEPRELTNINGTLFFEARGETQGWELWRSDGTAAGTSEVKDINPGSSHSHPHNLTNVDGTLFFQAYGNSTTGVELWKSNGTAAGTVLVKDVVPGAVSSYPSDLTDVNGTLFFVRSNSTQAAELWKSDGTAAGTLLVSPLVGGAGQLTNVNGTLFFLYGSTSGPRTLWQSDGTAAGTALVTNFSSSSLTSFNGTLFFAADDRTYGTELWKLVDDGPPSLTVGDVAVTEGHVGTQTATFTVALSAASGQPVTVQYATTGVTATSGGDFQPASGTLTFAPGERSKAVTVLVTGDRLGEPDETFLIHLSNPINATVADGEGVATIADDEPRLRATDRTAAEGNTGQTPFTFTVTLSAACDAPVTVNWVTNAGSATAGSDYVAAGGTLTFAPGETTRTVSVAVLGDLLVEPDETLTVLLGNPSGALIADGIGVGAIVNDDVLLPRISITDVTRAEGRNGTTLFVFTVTLSVPSAVPVTVQYATANGTARAGSDYEAAAGTLTFAPGETSKTLTVRVKGDRTGEADETFTVNLSGATNAEILDGTGLGTILNDD